MAQNIEYTVIMFRPDRKRPVTRRIHESKPIDSASSRQLLGYLTHKLFADRERGGDGTHYVLKIDYKFENNLADRLEVFSFLRTHEGEYIRV